MRKLKNIFLAFWGGVVLFMSAVFLISSELLQLPAKVFNKISELLAETAEEIGDKL